MDNPNPAKNVDSIGCSLEESEFKRILVPIDFSARTLDILQYAKKFAERTNAIVHVLHVIQSDVGRQAETLTPPGLVSAMGDSSRQELQRLIGILWENEMEGVISIRQGRVHEAILREANSTHTSLIIMETHHHSWPSRLLQRNIARLVIRNSSCPVLLLPDGFVDSTKNPSVREGSHF